MKLATAHAPAPNVPQNPVRANPGTVLHNVQGSSVSGRIPSLIQRQHSLESTQTAMLQKPYQEPNVPAMDPHAHVPPTTALSLSLIETPVRKYINTNNETVDDSPQRFLKQFSKSVASSQSNAVQSRIPIGPISSAIFGNNRDSRNVHELHDVREMHDGLPELPPEMIAAARQYLENEAANNENNNGPIYKTFYDPEASRELEAIDALRNAKGQQPGQLPHSQTTSYIVSTGNSSVFDSFVVNGNTSLVNPRLIKPKSIPHPGVNRDAFDLQQELQQQKHQQERAEILDSITKMVSGDLADPTEPILNNNSGNPVVHQLDMKKPVAGLKWMSLNENETSSSGATPASLAGDSSAVSQLNDLKKSETTADMTRGVPVPMVATTTKQSSSNYLSTLNTRTVCAAPTSAGIPVPLASKFHPLPSPSQKGPLGGR